MENISPINFIVNEELKVLDDQVFKLNWTGPFGDGEEKSICNIIPEILELLKPILIDATGQFYPAHPTFISRFGKDYKEYTGRSLFLQKLKTSDSYLRKYVSNPDIIIENIYWQKNIDPDGSNLERFVHDLCYSGFVEMFGVLQQAFQKMEFVPSVRTKIDRFYKIGSKESVLHELLLEFQKVRLSQTALNFLNEYVKEFDIAEGIKVDVEKDSSGSRIVFYKGENQYELADLGYGIAQIIPILLKMTLIINKNSWAEEIGDPIAASILIIEEPETNLHPGLQSKLANLFVDCYKHYNIQLIIETHSEYFIRKLQYIIANKKSQRSKYSSKDAIIYYFNNPDKLKEGEDYIKKINFNEDGSLSDDFGPGFFDEADNLSINLFNLNKSRKN